MRRTGITRRAALIGALTASALAVVLTTPAHAEVVGAGCEVSRGRKWFPPSPPYRYNITAYAYYTPISSGQLRRWTLFEYRLEGPVLNPGPHSNVNVRLYEGGSLRFENKSPDDRRAARWYGIRPDSPPITTVSGRNDVVKFETIFDNPRRDDPRCTAITSAI